MENFIFLCSGRSIVFVVNSEHNSIIYSEQVNVSWVSKEATINKL